MIVCPVCEHAQAQGAECEVCGRPFGRAASALPVVPLEGLETTHHAAGGALAPEPVAGLEPTRYADAPVLAEVATGIERTGAPPVDVEAAPLPDLERTQAELPGDGPTPPAPVVCRYCRTPALAGERLCSRCGMRLPVVAAAAAAGVPAAEPSRCSCGMPITGPLCPACGARASR